MIKSRITTKKSRIGDKGSPERLSYANINLKLSYKETKNQRTLFAGYFCAFMHWSFKKTSFIIFCCNIWWVWCFFCFSNYENKMLKGNDGLLNLCNFYINKRKIVISSIILLLWKFPEILWYRFWPYRPPLTKQSLLTLTKPFFFPNSFSSQFSLFQFHQLRPSLTLTSVKVNDAFFKSHNALPPSNCSCEAMPLVTGHLHMLSPRASSHLQMAVAAPSQWQSSDSCTTQEPQKCSAFLSRNFT